MPINNEDSRVKRTKKLIRQGLVELAKTKRLNKITVKELTDYIEINRGTFYLHYKDVYDLVDALENELYNDFDAKLSSYTVTRKGKGVQTAKENGVYVELFTVNNGVRQSQKTISIKEVAATRVEINLNNGE